MDNANRIKLEKRIVRLLITQLREHGFVLYRIYDGEEFHHPHSFHEINFVIFNLDEANLRFITLSSDSLSQKEKRQREHGVYLTLGEGIDIINDWSFTKGDSDGFSKAMDTVTDAIYEKLGK